MIKTDIWKSLRMIYSFLDMDGTLEPIEYLDTLVEMIKLLSWDVTKKSEALSKAESSRAEVIQPYDSTQKNRGSGEVFEGV